MLNRVLLESICKIISGQWRILNRQKLKFQAKRKKIHLKNSEKKKKRMEKFNAKKKEESEAGSRNEGKVVSDTDS